MNFLDAKLNLLESDLDRNTRAASNILEKIKNIEDPILGKTVNELRIREKALHVQIDYLLEERVKLKREIIRINSKTRSLRKSTVIITAIIMILAVASLIYTNELVNTKTSEILDQKINRLDIIAVSVEQEILDLQSILEISSRLPQVQDTSFSNLIERGLHGIPRDADIAKRSIANNILATNPNVAIVFFTMPNGDMYMVQPYYVQENLDDSNFAFRDWYMGVTKTHKPYLSEIFLAQGSNERALAIVTPVYSKEVYVGIFGVLLDMTHITNQFQKFSLEKGERLLVLDHHKNIVYDSQNTVDSAQISKFSDIRILNALNSESPNDTVKIDGVESLVLSHPIYATSNNWSVILVQPTEYAFADARTLFSFAAIIVGLIGAAAFCLGMFVLRSTRQNQHPRIESENESGRRTPKPYNNKKFYMLGIIASVALIVFFAVSLTEPDSNQPAAKSKFVIENLRGDTVNTWISWRLSKDEPLTVRFLNSNEISKDQMDAIKNALLSEESVMEDDSIVHKDVAGSQSKYYKGWLGALRASSQETKFSIPTTLDVGDSTYGEGDVIFHFTRIKDVDGYTGYTKSITDEHQILKSTITIYDVESLSPDQIATIARHEFGHALGLGHSTAPEDLMAPVITTPIPYISECDVDALNGLYDGIQNSQVVCKK